MVGEFPEKNKNESLSRAIAEILCRVVAVLDFTILRWLQKPIAERFGLKVLKEKALYL